MSVWPDVKYVTDCAAPESTIAVCQVVDNGANRDPGDGLQRLSIFASRLSIFIAESGVLADEGVFLGGVSPDGGYCGGMPYGLKYGLYPG